jgi:hypothetical protein
MRMPKPTGGNAFNQRGTFNRHLGAVSGGKDGAWCQVIHSNPLPPNCRARLRIQFHCATFSDAKGVPLALVLA